jgi:hypothetical protein
MIVMVAFQTRFGIPTTSDTCSTAFRWSKVVFDLLSTVLHNMLGHMATIILVMHPFHFFHQIRQIIVHGNAINIQDMAKGVHGTIHDIGLI